MMIDDEELRGIFKTSSEERLQALDEGLLHLEKHPDDPETLEALMRECHSLKGDSNMLGVGDLGKLAHQMEHVLGTVKRGEQTFSADTFDRLAHGMDAIRQMVHESVTGEPAEVDLFHVMAELMGANSPGQDLAETDSAADAFDLTADRLEVPDLTDNSDDMNILGDVLLGNEPLLDDPFGEPPPLNGFGDDPDIFLEPASTNPKVTAAAEVDADTLLEPESMDAGSPPPPATVAGNVPEISPHYIDDEEMRQIFKTSSEERLQSLDAGLLHLEKQPDDQATLEAILREAHSLKGDSNMLGVADLGKLAHQVEHILGAVKRGEEKLSADICDRLSHGMAAMKQLVHEAVTGEVTGVNPFYVLAELMGASTQTPPPHHPIIPPPPKSSANGNPPQPANPPTRQPPPRTGHGFHRFCQ